MYETFYNLNGKPFQLNPDPRFFFRSKGHVRAMAYLRFGLQQEQGFIIVTGDVGTGKTMLVNSLFRDMETQNQNIVAAKIVSTNVKEQDLLRLIAADFNLPYERATKASLLLSLKEFFESCMEQGKRVLLVIDECQNLPRPSLEELRMLSNFDFKGRPLVQSFLLGQREFKGILRSAGLEQLRQRVTAAYHLMPLSAEEVNQYVLHRLQEVGWKDDPSFEDGVFAEVFRFTRGVPRRINTLMDRLLLHACLEQTHRITLAETRSVTSELESEQGLPAEESAPEDPAEVLRAMAPAARAAAPQTSSPAPDAQQVELQRLEEKLEQRLAKVQQAVDRIGLSLQPAPTNERPSADHNKTLKETLFPFWTVSFSLALVVVLLVAGSAAYYLWHRSAG